MELTTYDPNERCPKCNSEYVSIVWVEAQTHRMKTAEERKRDGDPEGVGVPIKDEQPERIRSVCDDCRYGPWYSLTFDADRSDPAINITRSDPWTCPRCKITYHGTPVLAASLAGYEMAVDFCRSGRCDFALPEGQLHPTAAELIDGVKPRPPTEMNPDGNNLEVHNRHQEACW